MDLEQKYSWKIQKLERVLAQGSERPEDHLALANAYFRMGYYVGHGEAWLKKAAEKAASFPNPKSLDLDIQVRLLVIQGGAAFGLEAFKDAEAHYRNALTLNPEEALALVGLGNIETGRKDYQKARAFFSRAVELRPGLWQAHYNLGRAAHEEAQNESHPENERLMEQAIFHLVQSLEATPVESVIPGIYKELGELFLHTRRYDDAKKFFTRLTKHEPYAPLAYYYLGLTNFALHKHNSAIQNFRRYLKSVPDNALAHAKIGLSYLEMGAHERAREACQRALNLDAQNVLALFTIGCSHMDEGHADEACALFEKLLSISPDYVPAFIELTKAQVQLNNTDWLEARLRLEIQAFEDQAGLEGGRGSYAGPRGKVRRHIDILIDRLREMGPSAFDVLRSAMALSHTESLKFQIWEQLYEVSLQSAVHALVEELHDGKTLGDATLGQRLLELASYLEEPTLIDAFEPDENALRAAALERAAQRDDIGAYKKAIAAVKKEHRLFQGYILRALALKGSPEAERFLTLALESPYRELKLSAAVALVYYGNAQALDLLEEEATRLEDAAKMALKGLIHTGWERHGERHKVIRLGDPYPGPLAPLPKAKGGKRLPAKPSHCAICANHQREVKRMLAGRHLMVCTTCVMETWQTRKQRLHPPNEDAHCDFCRRSLLEVDALYDRLDAKDGPIHICEGCLDLSMGVLRQETVDKFLQEFR